MSQRTETDQAYISQLLHQLHVRESLADALEGLAWGANHAAILRLRFELDTLRLKRAA